jgi:tetratricopeptide (TPR) repeat protein
MFSRITRGCLSCLKLLPTLALLGLSLTLLLTACADSTGLTPPPLTAPVSQGGTATSTTGPRPDQKQALALNSEGEQALTQKNYTQAQAKFKAAVGLEPTNPIYQHNLALAYLGAGEPALAEAPATKAVELEPTNPLYHNTLGLVEARLSKPQEAAREARLAVQTDGGKPLVLWLNLSSAEYRLGRYAAAEEAARKATQLDPKQPEAWLRLANAVEGQSRYSEAIADYNQAITLNPNDPTYFTNLGNAYLALGDKAQAKAAYSQALALDPTFQPAKDGLALTN